MAFIEANHIIKDFKIYKNKKGFWGSVISLFHREYTIKRAVDDISFSLEKGEIVGYIGPNGAGKSTTIKMLAGVLIPDAGNITVSGIIPYKERKKNAKHIGVVFGQRSQLYWDLPVSDTFGLYQKLYEIPDDVYDKNRRMYTEILDIGDIIEQPVRQLSLGQKMKANLALAMLHDPDVLYLDEPTIGLDVMSKQTLRQSIQTLNTEKNVTIVLTTHDMDDIETLCKRLILIDKGHKLFDGAIEDFKESYEDGFMITLDFKKPPLWKPVPGFTLYKNMNNQWIIKVENNISSRNALGLLIERYDPENISIHEQDIEDIIKKIFEKSDRHMPL
jgi:ABC-2 type transport system ATP-binding protein